MDKQGRQQAMHGEVRRLEAGLERAIRDLDRYLARGRREYDRKHGKGAYDRLMTETEPEFRRKLDEELQDAL